MDPAPTPLDLNFRLLGVPVRVSPWFWLVSALFGSNFVGRGDPGRGLALMGLWVACTFLTIMWHEFGHALTFIAFGSPARVSLIAMGGLAIPTEGSPPRAWQRLLVSLAGPGAGFVLAGLVFVSDYSAQWGDHHWALRYAYLFLLWQNVVWGLFNLVPIWPLDGGQSLREILFLCGVRRPDAPTHLTGLVLAGGLVLLSVTAYVNPDSPIFEWLPTRLIAAFFGGVYMMVFMGLLAFTNWQAYQQHQAVRRDPWESDYPDDDDRPWARRR